MLIQVAMLDQGSQVVYSARTVKASDWLRDNIEADPENADWYDDQIAAVRRGETVLLGGGAMPLFRLTRSV